MTIIKMMQMKATKQMFRPEEDRDIISSYP